MSHAVGDYVKFVDGAGVTTHIGRVVRLGIRPVGFGSTPCVEIDGKYVLKGNTLTWYHPESHKDLPLMAYTEIEHHYSTVIANREMLRRLGGGAQPEMEVKVTINEYAPPAKHRAGLDPEVIDWDAHKAFLRGE